MPSSTARELRRLAHKLGFERMRQKGSHEIWNHSDGRIIVIPIHGHRTISGSLLHRLLDQLGVTLDEFQRLK